MAEPPPPYPDAHTLGIEFHRLVQDAYQLGRRNRGSTEKTVKFAEEWLGARAVGELDRLPPSKVARER